MKEINAYKAGKKAAGGPLEKGLSSNVFNVEIEGNSYTCFYIKNDSKERKQLIRISINGMDSNNISSGLMRDLFGDILKNQIVPEISSNIPSNVTFNNESEIFPNIMLNSEDFITLWVRLPIPDIKIKTDRGLNLSLSWVDV